MGTNKGRNMNPYSADYDCEVVDDVVVIFDLDCGNRSVTNDMPNVLHDVSGSIGRLDGRPIIYRDSTKTFDGVLHDGAEFRGFYPIGETVLEMALAKVRTMTHSLAGSHNG